MMTAVAQGIHVLAAALVAGALMFVLAALPAAATGDGRERLVSSLARRDVMRLIGVALAVAIAADILWLWSAAAGMSGMGVFESRLFPAIGSVLAETRFGRLWLARAGAAIVLAFLLLRGARPAGGSKGATVFAAALALALLASVAGTGHAAASARPGIEVAVLVLHILAAGIWFGGLAALCVALRAAVRGAVAEPFAGGVTRRFGNVAILAVMVLAAGGAESAFFRLSGAAALSSEYGQMLAMKSVLFAAALTLAARNRYGHLPLLSEVGRNAAARRSALVSLVRDAGIETVIVGAILLLAGGLAATPPA